METRRKIIFELEDASPVILWLTLIHALYIFFQRVVIRLGRAVTLRERTGAMPLFMTLFLGAALASALIIANPEKMPTVAVIYINLIFLTLVALGIAIKFRVSRYLPDSFLYHLFTFQVYAIIGAGIASALYGRSLFASLAVIFGYASSMVCLVAVSAHLGAGIIRTLLPAKHERT